MRHSADKIPEFLKRFLRYANSGWGERGKAWLVELPGIIIRCCEKRDLTFGATTEEIKGNFIAYAETANGEEAVLKVGVPHRDFSTEMEALAIYDGRGINRLIDCDKELNAMLLERVRPGKMLESFGNGRERAEIAANILVNLHQTPWPSNHTLPHFTDWIKGAFKDARDCQDLERSGVYLEQIPRVEKMMERLTKPDEPQILLHGDLHHWNILQDERRGWMAIDPKGVIGAACLDAGRFIGNATAFGDSIAAKRGILIEAITVFSKVLGEAEERIFAGAFCDNVMANCWGLKDEPDDREVDSRQFLQLMVEIGREIDLTEF
jgi:streptomycin 6-kinase